MCKEEQPKRSQHTTHTMGDLPDVLSTIGRTVRHRVIHASCSTQARARLLRRTNLSGGECNFSECLRQGKSHLLLEPSGWDVPWIVLIPNILREVDENTELRA